MTQKRLDLLFLDTCDMAMVEVAYEVGDSARYLLASANWKWAGFPYDQHLASAGSGDGRAIGLAWLHEEASYLKRWPGEPFTYALVDLSTTVTLQMAIDNLATALMRSGGPLSSPEGRQHLLDAANDADRYDSNQDGKIAVGNNDNDADTYVDLLSFSQKLKDKFGSNDPIVVGAANKVVQAMNSTIVGQEFQTGSPWRYPDQVLT